MLNSMKKMSEERLAEPLVTVIVPVFNVEEYVGTCLASIAAQTYCNLEIIIVDDGSTDRSGALCDAFAEKEFRATVVHTDNRGLSEARNTGLRAAHGQWISFVDSDDYVAPVFIEVLLKAALNTGCSMARIPFGTAFQDGATCELTVCRSEVPAPEVISAEAVQERLLYQQLDTAFQWSIYERKILGEDPFPKDRCFEDLATLYRLVRKVEAVAVIDDCGLYAYRLRKSGLIQQAFRPEKAESALAISCQLSYEMSQWYPHLAVATASRCFSVCRLVFSQIPSSERDWRKSVWAELAHRRHIVVRDSCARKRERIAAGVACLGMHSFSLFCRVCRRAGLLR